MNFRAAAELVRQNELGTQISGEAELEAALQFWLEANRADFAARVETALESHRGAARRMARQVHQEMRRPGASE